MGNAISDIEKIDLLERKVSEQIIWQYLAFIREVAMERDYDLIVLKARKASNLYQALRTMSLISDDYEPNDGKVPVFRKYHEKGLPVILSDRAIEYHLSHMFQDRTELRILIVDDNIIHGRTVAQLVEKIKRLSPNKSLIFSVKAFSANEKDMLGSINDEKYYFQDTAEIRDRCDLGGCRKHIEEIMDFLRLLGHPCTSYVPNIRLSVNSEAGRKITELIQSGDPRTLPLTCEKRQELWDIKGYAWIEDGIGMGIYAKSVRIYVNHEIGQCVLVPMISMAPIREERLSSLLEHISGLIDGEYYTFLEKNKEICFRAVIYLLSAVYGRIFLLQSGVDLKDLKEVEDAWKEIINFGEVFVKKKELDSLELPGLLDLLNFAGMVREKIEEQEIYEVSNDFQELDRLLSAVCQRKNSLDPEGCLMEFLKGNCFLDEESWKKYRANGKRLCGIPVYILKKRLENQFPGDRRCFAEILNAIDSGKGAIVASEFSTLNGQKYYISVIHGGERYYRSSEYQYLPILYGLYGLVHDMRGKDQDTIQECRERFLKKVFRYYHDVGRPVSELEQKRIRGIDIDAEYGEVLLDDAAFYDDLETMLKVIEFRDTILCEKGELSRL